MRMGGSGLVLVLAAVGWVRCGPDDPPEPAECDTSWEYDASATLRTWCTPCHHAEFSGEDRPLGSESVDLDRYEDVLEHLDRIEARALSETPTMPPGGGPSDSDLERLGELAVVVQLGGDAEVFHPALARLLPVAALALQLLLGVG